MKKGHCNYCRKITRTLSGDCEMCGFSKVTPKEIKMKKIFKYELEFEDNGHVTIGLPKDAWVVSVGKQDDKFMVWAMVDPTLEKKEDRKFQLVGTGWPVKQPDNLLHLGMIFDGSYVWHIFENLNVDEDKEKRNGD